MASSLLRNLASNWFGLVAAALLGFVVAPFIVNSLGKETFGLMALSAAVTGQLVILDFGVRQALVRALTRARVLGDGEALSKNASGGVLLNGLSALVALIIVAILGGWAGEWFELPAGSTACFQVLLALYAVDAAVHLALGTGEAGLAAAERYDLINAITVFRQLIYSVVVVLALSLGVGVKGVVLIGVCCRISQRVVAMLVAQRHMPALRIGRRQFDKGTLGELARYGWWASALILALRVIYHIDEIVCGLVLGVSSVAVYAVAVIIAEQLRNLYQASSTVLAPRLTSLIERGDVAGMEDVVGGWYSAGTSLGVLSAVPLITYGPAFVGLWMGPQFAESGIVVQLLAASFLILFPAAHFIQILYAANEHRLAAKFLLGEALVNVALSIGLGGVMGVAGVALGTLLPAAVVRGMLLPLAVSLRRGMRLTLFMQRVWVRGGAVALFLVGVGQLLLRVLPGRDWFELMLGVGLLVATCGAVLVAFVLRDEDRRYVLRRLGR